jgi:hypothetical protein
MEFSEAYKGTLCEWSPDGKMVAGVAEYRVYIRDAQTQHVCSIFTCLDTIDQIVWSGDSKYVLCSMHKRAVVQAWSIEHPDWYRPPRFVATAH